MNKKYSLVSLLLVAPVLVVLAVALAVSVVSYFIFSWGFVIMKFWDWFVVPLSAGLSPISIWQAMGLYLVVFIFRRRGKAKMPYFFKKADSGVADSGVADSGVADSGVADSGGKKGWKDLDWQLVVVNLGDPWVLLLTGWALREVAQYATV